MRPHSRKTSVTFIGFCPFKRGTHQNRAVHNCRDINGLLTSELLYYRFD
jgi:hypothetical protein